MKMRALNGGSIKPLQCQGQAPRLWVSLVRQQPQDYLKSRNTNWRRLRVRERQRHCLSEWSRTKQWGEARTWKSIWGTRHRCSSSDSNNSLKKWRRKERKQRRSTSLKQDLMSSKRLKGRRNWSSSGVWRANEPSWWVPLSWSSNMSTNKCNSLEPVAELNWKNEKHSQPPPLVSHDVR